MRGVLLSSLIGIAAVAGAAVMYRDKLPFQLPSVSTPAPAPRLTRKQVEDCRDRCEQQMVVAGSDEQSMRNCRKRCEGNGPSADAPHEVPSKITVAPARPAQPRVYTTPVNR
jgi:hypothetical protein